MGMELEEWIYFSCTAHIAEGNDWATLYDIQSEVKRQGHAEHLLKEAKKYYEEQGKRFGGSVALNRAMANLYKKLGIHEYNDNNFL